MPYDTVPFLTYRDEASLAAVLSVFSDAWVSRKHMVCIGDSMMTMQGGAGNARANVLAKFLAGAYGALPQTPLMYGRTATEQMSFVGDATNVLNSNTRVTSTVVYPANCGDVARAYGPSDNPDGLITVYDPYLSALTSAGPYQRDYNRMRHTKVMPTTGAISARYYMCTRPGANTLTIKGQTYAGSATHSIFGYSTVASGLSNGQNAAAGGVAIITQALTMNLAYGERYATMGLMASTVTDHIGVRYVAHDVQNGLSFDMFGFGGYDATEYATAFNAAYATIVMMGAPDLWVLRFGMNDAMNNNGNATYSPGLISQINAIRAVDPDKPILIIGTTQQTNSQANTDISNQPAIAQAIAQSYKNVVAVNTLLKYNPITAFDASGENLTINTAWATATSYVATDRRSMTDGRKYECINAHTSSTANCPPGINWRERNRWTGDGVHQSYESYEVETQCTFGELISAAGRFARPSALDLATFKLTIAR